jgi:DNA-binding SARP family transcriptional activator
VIAFVTSAARRLAGAVALALLTAGVPYALITYVDSPLPDQVPTWSQVGATLTSPLTDVMLGNALMCLLWAAWAAFVWSVVTEFARVLVGIRLPQPRAIAPARGLAALLVAAVTGGVLATAAQAAPALTPPATATGHIPAAAAPATVALPATTAVGTAAEPARTEAAAPAAPPAAKQATVVAGHMTLVAAGHSYTCVVKHGDTLSEIAKDWLGDPNRWPEIFALNRGTHFTKTGGTLTSPHVIYPGWTLELPDDATPPAGTTPTTQTHRPAPSRPTAAPDTGSTPSTSPTGHSTTPTTAPDTTPAPSTAAPQPTTADDGVLEPTSSGPTTPAGAPAATPATTGPDRPAATPNPTRATVAPHGVSLGGGSWMDMGLVAAVLAAVALVWAHRRRRYVPRPITPQPRPNDPTLTPMPPAVTRIRRALRRSTAPTPTDTDLDTLLSDELATGERESPTSAEPAEPGQPVTPALDNPLIEVWPPAGLGLTGPGAEAAARGFLVAALAAGGLDNPQARSTVVIPSGTLATLLGAAAVTVPDTPRLTVTGGLSDALALLEEQTLHRSRVCFDYEADTVAALRDTDPMAEPLPPMVLIADTTAAHERARIAALLTQGQRLDIHGVLLGPWPDGNTVTVADDGATHPADGDANRHGHHPADIGRLTALTAAEAADLLTVLGESHTGEPQPPAPTEHRPTEPAPSPTASTDDGPNDEKTPISLSAPPDEHTPATGTAEAPTSPHESTGDTEPAVDSLDNPEQAHEPASSEADPPASLAGRAEVVVLGPPQVVNADPTRSLRGKALELLVYLAARDGTATQETILEDLLPDVPTSKAPHRLHTYVYNLRRVLQGAGGPATYLAHPDRRYILNRDALDIDLWRMRAALTEAATATTPAARITALRAAVEAYQGPLADGRTYEWIEAYREAVQRQAVDAALALAEALPDRPEEALTVLTTAIGHHPYAEHLYQAAMRVHATLDNVAAIQDLHRTLQRRLDEIDTDVTDDTATLAQQLVAVVRQRAHRAGRREGNTTP